MLEFDYNKIKKAYVRKNYVFFTGEFNLNIFGIRGKDRKVNEFDDFVGVAYQEQGENKLFLAKATVDPGIPWLYNPMERRLGAAAIMEGQYRSLWRLGTFRNTPALLQINSVTCYRDNNRNSVFDYIHSNKSSGIYGIHLHEHFQIFEPARFVNASSAGCVVLASRAEHYKLIEFCEKQIKQRLGNTFTFTLFDEREL
jgi:hypothetical protein